MSVDADAGKDGDDKPKVETPPEVEAEIVDAEFTAADEPPEPEPAAQAAGEAGAAKPASRLPALPPKLLLPVVAAALVIVLLLVWRLWPRQDAASEATPPAAAVAPAESTEAVEAAPAPQQTAPEPESAPETEPEPAPYTLPDASKISNAGAASVKADLDEVDTTPVEGARGLPEPPPPGNANQDLQRAAKDALKSLGAETSEETAPAFEVSPPQEDAAAPALEEGFAQLQEQAEAADTAEAAGRLADSGTTRAEIAVAPANDKIGNDIAALKELFATETGRLSSELSVEKERAEALERDVASLKQDLGAALAARRDNSTGEELAALKAEVEKIRAGREQAVAGKAAAATFALVGLQQKVAAGAPYADELERLASFAPGAAGLETLRVHAETGVATLGALQTRFGPAIRQTLVADREARAKGFWGALFARLEGLISVRPATPQAGTSARAVISRAEARLAADDLAGTVAELRGLQGAARDAIAPWFDDAEARVAADAALADLSLALAGRVQN